MSLELVKSALLEIPAQEIRRSPIPIAHAVQEASDLIQLCEQPGVKEALLSVGLEPGFLEDLEQRLVATRQAQSIWQGVRTQTKSAVSVALREHAQTLRAEMLAAGRFHLKGRDARACLDAVRGGTGVDDLVQDLFDLAQLYEKHACRFARDESFDLPARIAEARSVGAALSSQVSKERHDPRRPSARELRDRAFSHMDVLVRKIRETGRYAFRKRPVDAQRFTSRYRRKRRWRETGTMY